MRPAPRRGSPTVLRLHQLPHIADLSRLLPLRLQSPQESRPQRPMLRVPTPPKAANRARSSATIPTTRAPWPPIPRYPGRVASFLHRRMWLSPSPSPALEHSHSYFVFRLRDIVTDIRYGRRNTISAARPLPQINQTAALAAKRKVLGAPLDFSFAGWAF